MPTGRRALSIRSPATGSVNSLCEQDVRDGVLGMSPGLAVTGVCVLGQQSVHLCAAKDRGNANTNLGSPAG